MRNLTQQTVTGGTSSMKSKQEKMDNRDVVDEEEFLEYLAEYCKKEEEKK